MIASDIPSAGAYPPGEHPGPPRLILLREHERRPNVPLSAAQADVLRRLFGQFVAVQRAWDGPGYDLTPGGYVGDIILDGLRLRIQPKAPLDNLFYMLTYAARLARFRDEATTLGAADDLFEFIVSIFARQVDGLVRNGIVRGYVEQDEAATYLRGRLLLAEQLRRSVAQPGRFQQRSADFTADLRENRILKATLDRLARLEYEDPALRPRLRRTLSAFSEVALLDVRPEECDRVIFTRLNRPYVSPLALARLLLQRLSLESHEGSTPFAAFLLPVHEVFEGFVSAFLEEQLAGHPRLSAHRQYHYALDVDGQLSGEPDNLLRRDGRPWLILDTKYKVYDHKPSPADLNQMVTYCQTLGIGRALLLYPDGRPKHDRFSLHGGVVVETRVVSLDGPLEAFRERWQQWAAGLIAAAGN